MLLGVRESARIDEGRVGPISDAEASPEGRAIFEACQALIGRVPNLIRIVADSPHQARGLVVLTMAAAVWNMTNRLNESLHTHLRSTPPPSARSRTSRRRLCSST